MSKVKMEPPFRAYATAGQEIAKRQAIETKKIDAIDRRTAVMERLAAERASAREARAQKREAAAANPPKPHADFAARRAEIDAILETAREAITEQLLLLCEEWQASGDITVARCCADLSKLAKTLQ